jgi:carboxyl-terminal processing protease
MTSWCNSTSRACTNCFSTCAIARAAMPPTPSPPPSYSWLPGRSPRSKGQTVSHKDFNAEADKDVWHSAVDVLISPSTSGAAEVLAGAIKGNKRGELVGERTFGSASEQKMIPLDDGGALILTVAFYSTPDGKSIVEDGVAPTVEVHPKAFDPTADASDIEDEAPLGPGQLPKADDPVYNKGLELLKGGEAQKAA